MNNIPLAKKLAKEYNAPENKIGLVLNYYGKDEAIKFLEIRKKVQWDIDNRNKDIFRWLFSVFGI